MGSTSDLPIMEKAAKLLDECEIPFEMLALSAHRTPAEVEEFAKNARSRGIKVIIAAAGMAAHLPGVIASMTTLPVIGVPIKSGMEGLECLARHRANASRNSRSDGRSQRSPQRSYSRHSDLGARRRNRRFESRKIQNRTYEKNR